MSNKTLASSSFKIDGIDGLFDCTVNETKANKLSKAFDLKVKNSDCARVVNFITGEFAKTAKIKGFRPGKVPAQLVKKQHLDEIMSEAAKLLVKHSSFLVTKDHKVAGDIDINVKSFDEENGLDYEVGFDVLPEISLPDFSKVKLTKLVCEPTDEEIEKSIKEITETLSESEPAAPGTQAKEGDAVVIDFVGKFDGIEFAGGSGKSHKLELGSKSFIDNFEEQLVGSKAGDKKLVKVKFPTDYHSKEHAGREAEFDVEVQEVHHVKPAAIDDELARKFGLKDLAELQTKVKEQIVVNLSKVAHDLIKKDLFDELEKHCKFECPEKMLSKEIEAIKNQFDGSEQHKEDELEKIAERRVKLGLLLSSVASNEKLEVKDKDIQQQLMKIVSQYPGQEKAIIDFYQKNPRAIASLKGPAIEDKAVEFILSKATTQDKKVSADELVKMSQEA